MKSLIVSLSLALLFSCQNNAQQKTVSKNTKSKIEQGLMTADPVEVPLQDGKARAYFASGCFWCVEAVFEDVKGVIEVVNGYAGGEIKNPSYREVSSGKTKHAEVCKITYDSNKISLVLLKKIGSPLINKEYNKKSLGLYLKNELSN